MLTIYTLPICPNCESLKSKLDNAGVVFATKNLEDDSVRIELLMDSVTLVEAPIVRLDDGRYLSRNDALKELKLC